MPEILYLVGALILTLSAVAVTIADGVYRHRREQARLERERKLREAMDEWRKACRELVTAFELLGYGANLAKVHLTKFSDMVASATIATERERPDEENSV